MSGPLDIDREWAEAVWFAALSADLALPWLEAEYGVTESHFAAVGGAGLTKACFTDDSFYEPDESGHRSIVLPVREWCISTNPDGSLWEGWHLRDLAAFQMTNPDRFGVRLGAASILGIDQASKSEWEHIPLHVRRTPIDWLMASGVGVCIVRWEGVQIDLRSCARFVCQDLALGERLDAAMNPPKRYEIRIAGGAANLRMVA